MTSADQPLFLLARFVEAQAKNGIYQNALCELNAGKNPTHWMWFVFSQLAGLGESPIAQFCAIKSMDEAKAYLAHSIF